MYKNNKYKSIFSLLYLIIQCNFNVCSEQQQEQNLENSKKLLSIAIPIVDIQEIIANYVGFNLEKILIDSKIDNSKTNTTASVISLVDLFAKSPRPLDYSPNGKYLAYSNNESIGIWDTDCNSSSYGERKQELKQLNTIALKFTPDKKIIAINPKGMAIFEISSGTSTQSALGKIDIYKAVFCPTNCYKIAFIENTAWLSFRFFIADIISGKIQKIDEETRIFSSLDFSPNGKLLASCSRNEIKLWQVDTGEYIRTFNNSKNKVYIKFLDNTKLIAGTLMQLEMFNVNDGNCIQIFKENINHVLNLKSIYHKDIIFIDIDRNNTIKKINDRSKTLKRLNTITQKYSIILEFHDDDLPEMIIISPQANFIAIGFCDGSLKIFKDQEKELLSSII